MKIISERAFNELKSNGGCVPRVWDKNDPNDTITPFAVGKEVFVKFKGGTESIKVRCTQNCPYFIKKVETDKN